MTRWADLRPTARPDVKFNLALAYEQSWTVDQIRQAAYEQIRLLLRSANRLADATPLQELQRRSDALQASAAPPSPE